MNNNDSQNFDIIIVGGSFIGLSLVRALSSLSLRIAVIEANPAWQMQTSTKEARALVLADSAKQIYQAIGLWPSIQQYANPIEKIHVSYRKHFGRTCLNAADEGVPAFGYVVEAYQFLNDLFKGVEQLPNVSIFFSNKITNVAVNEQHAQVMLQNGQQLTAKLLVGADGGRSTVRELAGINARQTDYQQYAVVTTVGLKRSHANIAYERFTDAGPIAMLPLNKQRCGVVVTVDKQHYSQVLALDDNAFVSMLMDRFGHRLGSFAWVSQRQGYPLHMLIADEQIKSRIILLGNAAHSLHPVAGQGLNLGLRDMGMFVELLTETWHLGQDIGSMQFLKQYQDSRQQTQHKAITFTDILARYFSSPFKMVNGALALSLLLFDNIPVAKHLLANWGMGRSGKISRLSLGIPLGE